MAIEKTYTVVLRGPSAAILRPDQTLEFEGFPSALGRVDIRIRSRWLKPNENVTLPGNLWIEIAGTGNALKEVIGPFATAGAAILPLISMATNAAIPEPEIELAFESTSGAERREYFQSFISAEVLPPTISRFIRPAAIITFIDHFQRHPELQRLIRAINQYRVALDYWRMGHESQTVSHLWMAVEALTKALIRIEFEKRGLSENAALAADMGIDLKDLDSTIRREFIFESDDETFRKTKRVSDGLEPGFLDYAEMNSLARDVRKKAAEYVRNCILKLCGLPSATYAELTLEGTHKPLGHWPVAKYVRGTLVGASDSLAAEDNLYPFLHWTSSIEEASIDENGEFRITPRESITPNIAEGLSLTDLSLEVWRPD